MNNWKVIPTIVCATVLIFGAGVFTGGILVNCVKQPQARPAKHPATAASANAVCASNPVAPSVKPPEILSQDFLQRLEGELHLTKDQHETIQKIIQEGQNSVRKAVQDARLEIREVLTPGQRKAFDELVKRPFHKAIFDTNTTFQARLNQLLERQRINQSAEALSPEAQVLLIEEQRAQAAARGVLPPSPPCSPPTNAP